MPIYSYSIINREGKEKKGSIEAADKETAMNLIKDEDIIILSIQEGSVLNKEVDLDIFKKRISTRDLSVFCRQFTSIMKAGVNIVAALQMLGDQTENKRLRNAIYSVMESVQKGETLGNSMRKQNDVFPALLINMVDSGEASGSLEVSLERMAVQFEKEAKIKSMIKKAMMYPMVLLGVTIAVLIVMCMFIIPNFVGMFEEIGTDLPGFTVFVLRFSTFMAKKWYVILILIFLIVAIYRTYKSTYGGARRIARLKLKIPVFGMLTKKTVCARFARTLSTLLSSGVSLVESLNITSKAVGNVLYKDELTNAASQVQRGMTLSTILKKNKLFPPMILHMLGIGEETGNMEEMLTNAANYYEEEVETGTGQVMALMEPMIIIIMAIAVIILIAAVYGPVMELSNSIY